VRSCRNVHPGTEEWYGPNPKLSKMAFALDSPIGQAALWAARGGGLASEIHTADKLERRFGFWIGS